MRASWLSRPKRESQTNGEKLIFVLIVSDLTLVAVGYSLFQIPNRLLGRIYPHYLLTKLYSIPEFYNPEQLKNTADVVLTKEPEMHSSAVREMRNEVKKFTVDKMKMNKVLTKRKEENK